MDLTASLSVRTRLAPVRRSPGTRIPLDLVRAGHSGQSWSEEMTWLTTKGALTRFGQWSNVVTAGLLEKLVKACLTLYKLNQKKTHVLQYTHRHIRQRFHLPRRTRTKERSFIFFFPSDHFHKVGTSKINVLYNRARCHHPTPSSAVTWLQLTRIYEIYYRHVLHNSCIAGNYFLIVHSFPGYICV